MQALTVAEIVRATSGVLVIGDPQEAVGAAAAAREPQPSAGHGQPHVDGLTIDSRAVRKGDIFVAIRGERFDGHDFLNQCIEQGAAACIVSQVPANLQIQLSSLSGLIKVKDTKRALADLARYYRLKFGEQLRVAGIAGSCGKTSVKEMTAQILSAAGPTVYSQGNFNNEIGCPISLLNILPSHRYGVFEIGSSALGEVKRLAELVLPQVAIITNIQLEHTATFGTIQQIAEGESEILSALPSAGWAVLPRDDEQFEYLRSRVPAGCKVKTFGLTEQASVSVQKLEPWPAPMRFQLVHRDDAGRILETLDCTLPVLGRFNALNAAAAAAAAFCMEIPSKQIVDALSRYRPPNLRFQIVRLENGAVLVNDSYNANPGSMRSSISSFVEAFPDKKRCAVIADMLELGEISRAEHRELGKFLAQQPLERVVLYGGQAKFALDGAREALMDERSIVHCADAESLYRAAQALAAPGRAVLFKGSRGMKLDEIVRKLSQDHAIPAA